MADRKQQQRKQPRVRGSAADPRELPPETEERQGQFSTRGAAHDLVRESLEGLKRDAHQEDLVLDLDKDTPRSGPEYVGAVQGARSRGVIDRLLIGCQSSQGDYLKLYKNLGGGNYEVKARWDHEYEAWVDLEWEVTKYVRDMTKKFGAQRWGSGNYRIRVGRGAGARGPEDPPIDLYIDAEEPDRAANGGIPPGMYANPVEGLGATVGMFSQMASAMKALQPEQKSGTDPMLMLILTKMLDSSNNNGTGLWGIVVPAMAPLIREMLVKRSDMPEYVAMLDKMMMIYNSKPVEKPKSLLEQMAEIKALTGHDPFRRKELSDVAGELRNVMELVNSMKGLSGGDTGEPSIAGVISQNLGKILDTINTVLANRQTEMAIPIAATAGGGGGTPDHGGGAATPGGIRLPADAHPAIMRLVTAIVAQDEGAFPMVTELIQQLPSGLLMLKDLKTGAISLDDFIALLRMYTQPIPGGLVFRDPQLDPWLRTFCAAYFEVMQGKRGPRAGASPVPPQQPIYAQAPPPSPQPAPAPLSGEGPVTGRCDACGQMYDYPSEAAYVAEAAETQGGRNRCGKTILTTGMMCPGFVLLVQAGADMGAR